ncbi:MAG: peptide chain release factor N(5)-glutamine methyltransferase, partial [Candidatus Andersenbacteria bacterium]
MTIHEALKKGQAALSQSDAPDLDAERLLLFVVKEKESTWLIRHNEEELTDAQHQHYQRLIIERVTGKPLAYILGEWDFYGRRFAITPAVLVPRPSTEKLVDTALETIKTLSKKLRRPIVVADIGTGSGCIAITLALETSRQLVGNIYATDISEAALDVARANATQHNVNDRIQFVLGDMLEPIEGKKFDLIVSNPPYVPTAELRAPDSDETRGLIYEPRIALDGGEDGSIYIQQIKESGVPAIIEIQQGKVEESKLQ